MNKLILFFVILAISCGKQSNKDSTGNLNLKTNLDSKTMEQNKCNDLINEFKEIGNNHRSLNKICKIISNDTFYSNWKIEWVYGSVGIDPFIDYSGVYGHIAGQYYVITYKSQIESYLIKAIIEGRIIKATNLFEFCNDSSYNHMYVNKYEINETK